MEGTADDSGVSLRAVSELLLITNDDLSVDWDYILNFSMLEIYNETIRDLLVSSTSSGNNNSSNNNSSNKLDVRLSADGNNVPGLTEKQVQYYIQ